MTPAKRGREIRAVLFDFDGVICQTETARLERFAARLAELGMGCSLAQLAPLAGGMPPDQEKFWDQLLGQRPGYPQVRQQVLQRLPPPRYDFRALLTPGLPETLQALQNAGLSTAVVSNSRCETIEAALKDCGVRPLIGGIFSGWDLDRRKPDPFIYRLAMERLKLPPKACVILEDSPLGIQAGRAAGAFVAALRDRDGLLDQSGADVQLTQIGQLLDLLGLRDNAAGPAILAGLE